MTGRFGRLKPSQKAAIIILVVLLTWLVIANVFRAGGTTEEERVALDSEKDLSNLVKIEELTAQPHALHIVLNGATEANRMVRIKAQVEGAVAEVLKQEGDTVKQGEVILRLEPRDRKARVAQGKALLEQRKVEYEAAKKLNQKGVYSDVRFSQSAAQYEEAKAYLSAAQTDFDNITIRAPFDGVLEERHAEVGDLVGRGPMGGGDDSVATVVDFDPLVVVGQVPQQRRNDIDTKKQARIRLFGTEEYQGSIRYLGTVTNADTRTFRIEVEIPNAEGELPVGVSAEMHLPAGEAMAYNIAPSVLSQDDTGKVGVKIVDENNVVQFVHVDLLEDSNKGFWVGGLPERIRLVTTGQNFVSAGQTINSHSGEDE